MSIGGHQSARAKTHEWLTPPSLLHALGGFDLDPCAPPPERRPWPTAIAHYHQDGLVLPWAGRVWLNPPYGPHLGRWLERMGGHQNGIALVFARTETRAFQDWVWPLCSAMLFLDGRLHFHWAVTGERSEINAGAPSVLIAYDRAGDFNAGTLRDCGIAGAWLDTRRGLIMAPSASWQGWRALVEGLIQDHGPLPLERLYTLVENRADLPSSNTHIRAKIRQTLYRHCQRSGDRWTTRK